MKRLTAAVLCLLLCLGFSACGSNRTEEHALERLEDYAYAIGHDFETPGVIYAYLCEDFRSQMTEEEFCEAWEKERSYPYLTPLYIYNPEITMNEDGMSGTATYIQAARLEGMHYTLSFVYENGDWYIVDWEEFLDGSYLDKFEDVIYDLSWYYNTDETEE